MSETHAAQHDPAIDVLKGLLIVLVILAHSGLGQGSWLGEHLLIRAPFAFMVLFGVTSSLWWQHRAAKDSHRGLSRRWYATRLPRLYPPFLLMIACWWALASYFDLERLLPGFGAPEVVASFAAYAPWLGTTWFVTVLLVYVLLFPALCAAANRISAPVLLVGAAFVTCS
ncbi:MAG TPA: acyltransferase family protein [Polyangiaceae bacterium]|nr:acyltransferase family protein [Polyangiaceae bacterium]